MAKKNAGLLENLHRIGTYLYVLPRRSWLWIDNACVSFRRFTTDHVRMRASGSRLPPAACQRERPRLPAQTPHALDVAASHVGRIWDAWTAPGL